MRSALLLVERGDTPAGIVSGTDAAVFNTVMVAGVFPADSHNPVTYRFAATETGDTPEARASLTLLSSAAAQAVWRKAGFRIE